MRRRDLAVELEVTESDQLAAGHVAARRFPHPLPGLEPCLQVGMGRELGRIGLVHAPPQLLVTLETGEESRLRQAGKLSLGGHVLKSNAGRRALPPRPGRTRA